MTQDRDKAKRDKVVPIPYGDPSNDDILNSMDCGVSVFDANLVLVACNAKYGELLEFPAEMCRPGTPLESFIRYNADRGEYGPGNVDELVTERIERAKLGRPHRFERVRPDGTLLEIAGNPMPSGGFVTTYTTRGTDTRGYETSDVALEILRTALDYTSDGFQIWDFDDRLIYANARMYQMCVADDRKLLIGETFPNHLRMWMDDRPAPPGFQSIDQYIEWRIGVHRAGDRAILQEPSPGSWVLVRDHVLPNRSRLTTVLDVSDLKRAERQAFESEQRFRDFVDASSDRFWETDTDHIFTALADTGLAGHAPPAANLIGRTRWDHVGADPVADPKWAEHKRLLDRQEPFRDFRYDIASPLGEIRHWRVSGVPVFDELDRFRGYRGTATDETEARRAINLARKDLEQALQNAEIANRAKTMFLATVSHELRTPLNAIIGFADLIREQMHGKIGDPRYLEYIDSIRLSGSQLHRLIEDVLDMSRVEMGQLVLRESWIDLAREVSAACDTARTRYGLPPHRLTLWKPETPPPFWGDARMIRQIAVNLISNAIKFSGDKGDVEVDVSVDETGVMFSVTDYGVGIDAAEIDKILRPFEQADTRLSRTYEGLGLGLPLARAFAELHGGSIKIESELGKGTRLEVRFGIDRVKRT